MIVVNLRREPYDVYIGRAGKGQDGYFGNPFPLKNYSDPVERKRVLSDFTNWFNRRVSTDAVYAQRVLDLRGKRCGCFCKPLACHGDVLSLWVENAMCCICGNAATIAVDPHDLDERETRGVVLLCPDCGK
jgi:hypothetical protein